MKYAMRLVTFQPAFGGFLIGPFFRPEDEADMFPRNVGLCISGSDKETWSINRRPFSLPDSV
jgi:hypothetical protein